MEIKPINIIREMEKEFNPIIEGMKKATIIKEAIASVELDKGQTQTITPEKEFNLDEEIHKIEKRNRFGIEFSNDKETLIKLKKQKNGK